MAVFAFSFVFCIRLNVERQDGITNMKSDKVKQLLRQQPDLGGNLFIRGFLITTHASYNPDVFPFLGNWKQHRFGHYSIWAHKQAGVHLYPDAAGNCFFLLGHAYDPFAMDLDEDSILRRLAAVYGTAAFMERVNDLTGVFVLGVLSDRGAEYLVDPSGMQSACSGTVNGDFFLSSHAQLIGDLCDLQMDPFVEQLIRYKWYGRVMGPYLPGDLTPFTPIKRIVPSIYYRFQNGQITHKRFWPLQALEPALAPEDYAQVIRDAADILKRNMELVSKKWRHPWISLTGGIDSNTTFASANGIYDRFESFSYISAEKEIADAAAAKQIADRFHVTHHEYHIPDSNAEVADYDTIRAILMHNNGYVAETRDNEIRKRIFLRRNVACDVEVKSWVSETIRAYWYKHYDRKRMPSLSPKLFRNLYKIFLLDRGLAHKIDRLFADYIREYEYESIPACYPPADMHYNEVTWGSWGGLNISEMKYCFDITFIYNNRRFFDLMFRVPLEKRISDQHHLDMKKYLNPDLYDMGIRIVNLKETNFRAFALNIIFTINSFLPF